MGPSAYHATLTKDQLVEDRGGVKVIFAGGNVFHVRPEGVEKPISVRGAKAAWERSEAERHKLDPQYQPIAYEKPFEATPPEQAETEGAQTGPSPAAPADNVDESEGEANTDPDDKPDAAVPSADGAGAGEDGDDDNFEGGEAAQGEPVQYVSFEAGKYPIHLVGVEAVTAALGEIQVRLPGFIGDPKLSRLVERVRATDGCCAPIFFTGEKMGEEIQFFAGLETLGAAIHLGMEQIAVVIVPPEVARASQGPIAAMLAAANAATGSQDDDMVYRAYQ
jgi:hypothetical protein